VTWLVDNGTKGLVAVVESAIEAIIKFRYVLEDAAEVDVAGLNAGAEEPI